MTTKNWNKFGAASFTIDDPRIEPCPTTGCWLWMGGVDKYGYARGKWCLSRYSSQTGAYRLTYERMYGPIPDGLVCDHIVCRNPVCVNPDHLRLVSIGTNVTENSNSVSAQHKAKKCCPKCSGPYTLHGKHRVCHPCRLKRRKERQANPPLRLTY